MIALGGTIGTGLFVGAGEGLSMAGTLFSVASIHYHHRPALRRGISYWRNEFLSPCSRRFNGILRRSVFSKSLGFALGWIYWYIFSITVPAEITVANLVLDYWNPPISAAFWLTLIGIVMIAINCFPVKVSGETEFWFASTKVVTIVGLIFLTVILFLGGGGPTGHPLWFSNWTNPSPTKEYIVEGAAGRVVAFFSVLVLSVYAFALAPELLVVTGGEMASPRQNLLKATRR